MLLEVVAILKQTNAKISNHSVCSEHQFIKQVKNELRIIYLTFIYIYPYLLNLVASLSCTVNLKK